MSERTLQDPSAPMKRAMFRALAIGAIAVILYMFCVQPSQSSLDKAKADLVGLQAQQSAMVRDLKGADQVKARLDAIDAERKEFLAGLLEPLLGSYAMRAKSVLDPLATDVGLRITDYAEMPVSAAAQAAGCPALRAQAHTPHLHGIVRHDCLVPHARGEEAAARLA